MRKERNIVSALVAAIILTIAMVPALPAAQKSKSDQKSVEIPVCSKSFGTLAVVDHRDGVQWWLSSELNLSPPSVLITDFVRQSRCFNLVDRSTGFLVAKEERELFANGMLQPGANVGLGQIIAADYIMVAALVGQNMNERGVSFRPQDVMDLLDDAFGIGLPRIPGIGRPRIPGSINTDKKTADVVLQIVNTRSSAIVATIQGHGTKTDVNFRIFGNGDPDGFSRYAKTDMGRVITKAYLDAYIKITEQFPSLPENASTNINLQAFEVIRPSRLLVNPQDISQAVRSLDVGMLLYPTGNKEGIMWEVKDESGHSGWVSAESFRLAGRSSTDILVVIEDNPENEDSSEDGPDNWENW